MKPGRRVWTAGRGEVLSPQTLTVLALAFLLSACAPAPFSPHAAHPEAPETRRQVIPEPFSGDPAVLSAQARLAYVKALAWGSMSAYEAAYADQASANTLYPGLDWSRDGCSAPSGLDLGYSEVFRPACNIHDFGYRNLKVLERTPENRETTDHAFYADMLVICQTLPWVRRPECCTAAFIYESGVRLGGESHF